MESDKTELIEHQTITAICENVEQAKLEAKQGFEMLRAAKRRLELTLGGKGYYHDILPSNNHYGDSVFDDRSEKESYDHITRNAWRYILDQTGLRQYMTERRQKELEEQIRKNELPPLTADNIVGTLQGLAGRVNSLLDESIKEVFNWLRPSNHWGTGALKTNQRWKVGPKVIVYGCQRNYSGGFAINYHREANFTALGNVFSLLDGKGVQKYPDDFRTRFNEGMKTKGAGEVWEDEYFRCKCYGNGNLHIDFKRLDLVRKLNKAAGGDDLPGQEPSRAGAAASATL